MMIMVQTGYDRANNIGIPAGKDSYVQPLMKMKIPPSPSPSSADEIMIKSRSKENSKGRTRKIRISYIKTENVVRKMTE